MISAPERKTTAVKTEAFQLTPALTDEACELAETLLKKAIEVRTKQEIKEARKTASLLQDDQGKEFTFHLADSVFHPPTANAQAKVLRKTIQHHGTPGYIGRLQGSLLHIGSFTARFLPQVVMPLVKAQVRYEARKVILDPSTYPGTRQRSNLCLLGEAILGEDEAKRRFQQHLDLLASPETTYISVKLSSIFSQINLLDWDASVSAIQDRLRPLYRSKKFINLDMEDYRDLRLTVDAFRKTLDEDEFAHTTAGIVLQAYLPDSFHILKELAEWAKTRAAPIKIRLVKGANLAMEKVDAELHGWEQAPFTNKADVDANFKRMLLFAVQPEIAKSVHLGVASHNIFDLSLALLLRDIHELEDSLEIEMLEGMANDQINALKEIDVSVLPYAPMVERSDFPSALAYLVRRLDENTSPENFLAHIFSMTPGSPAWKEQEQLFREACAAANTPCCLPRRKARGPIQEDHMQGPFSNSPDTDWTLPENRTWLECHLNTAVSPPSPPMATHATLEETINSARSSSWGKVSPEERATLLQNAAYELERARGPLISIMRKDANKRPFEADIEVSEAVDFANYYSERIFDPEFTDGIKPHPRGITLVTPPWNFPCAIPCGGVLSALAMGNPVILKPAPETVQTASVMINCLWKAGIPRDALHFLPCSESEIGKALITHPEIKSVILTGASETAQHFKTWRPDLHLIAETSGKNALYLSASCDPDLAIKDLVSSAFFHAGQKCSAASVALISRELCDSPAFLEKLRDAANSLKVAEATDSGAIVTPLIQKPSDALHRALTQLEPGESWLLEPRQLSDTLWSPGIRLGVRPGSWLHKTEVFGPVLAVIPVKDVAEALVIQNSSDFGLTGGIHSLDRDEISYWRETVEVGNAYINRPITGAIVKRQPFGGWKNSAVGGNGKAGGPNALVELAEWKETALPALRRSVTQAVSDCLERFPHTDRLSAAAESYAYWWESHFSKEHDPSGLTAESNHFRYKRRPSVTLGRSYTDEERALIEIAACTAGVPIVEDSSDPLSACLTHDPMVNGRLELRHYLLEQSISETRHRHGRLV